MAKKIETGIHTRALQVWLTLTTWTARKYDKKATAETNQRYSASADASRVNKCLMPGDAPAYKELIQLCNSIRNEHYAKTLAWSDAGWRLLTTKDYMGYTQWFRGRSNEFDNAFDRFATDYPNLKTQAKKLLGPKLWNDDDYPSVGDLKSRFVLQISYAPIAVEGDIRVDLAADQIAAIEDNVRSRQGSELERAMSDCWTRLYTVVSRMQERLNEPEAIFRDTLVTNITDLCDALKSFNIANDPSLESMRQRVLTDLTKFSPDTLRDDPKVRKAIAKRADDILKAMSGVFAAA